MKKVIESTKCVQVGEQEFNWRIHRQPQWCTNDGWRGLAIHVELARDPQRALILDYPFKIEDHRSTPHRQRPFVSEKALVAAISAALVAGWNPESRGKPFVFDVPDPA